MQEEWRKIPGYPSKYEVSNLGRLKSHAWKGSKMTRVLKPAQSPDGYLKTVLINNEGKKKSLGVHTWVAVAFIGKRPDNKEVNHKNGIKTDNRAVNLEYMTRSENILHAIENGLYTYMRGSDNGHSKLTEDDVREIRRVASQGGRYYGRKALAEKYGISEGHVKDIVNRRRNVWGHI